MNGELLATERPNRGEDVLGLANLLGRATKDHLLATERIVKDLISSLEWSSVDHDSAAVRDIAVG
jgi:hypothetical protein